MSNLTLYRINEKNDFYIRKSPLERDWMEDTENNFAYRCLPLNIANQHGWEISLPHRIRAIWDGGDEIESVQVLEGNNSMSHFGSGILTMSLNFMPRTDSNINIYVTGTPNNPKRGIYPLTGIIESDWNPSTFTMNWKFTEPDYEVVFEAFEPICWFFPVQRGLVDNTTVKIKKLSSMPEEYKNYEEWSLSREQFIKNENKFTGDWQKHYFQGKYNDGMKCPVNHQVKLKLDDPIIEDPVKED